MAKSFTISIVTPEKEAFAADVVSVILPGSEGYLGIWANHAPLVSGVAPGIVALKLDDAGTMKYLSVSSGFVEVSDNKVNLMVDSSEDAGEIDVKRAQKALERARERLASVESTIDRERAALAAERARARLRAAQKERGR
jgi:F-type H+-transporting ATPase subunit epsilon